MNKFNGGILSGLSIKEAIIKGDIVISPLDLDHIDSIDRFNPASYDLTLGNTVAVYEQVTHIDFSFSKKGVPGERLTHKISQVPSRDSCLDAAKANLVVYYEMSNTGFMLKPGIGYLMHTHEKIKTNIYAPILDGKSSIGRLFLTAHITAGYGDPGFDGQYTLEVIATHPIIIYPGMRFCQIRFHTIVGDVSGYENNGNYKGSLASGPVPSRSWKLFL